MQGDSPIFVGRKLGQSPHIKFQKRHTACAGYCVPNTFARCDSIRREPFKQQTPVVETTGVCRCLWPLRSARSAPSDFHISRLESSRPSTSRKFFVSGKTSRFPSCQGSIIAAGADIDVSDHVEMVVVDIEDFLSLFGGGRVRNRPTDPRHFRVINRAFVMAVVELAGPTSG